MKRLLLILLLVLPLSARAQRDTLLSLEARYTDEFLDTVNVRKKLMINDYSMIGVQYGIGMNSMSFNPTKKQSQLITPLNVGITFTHYEKMFGLMPYFGFQAGLFYGQDGYLFKKDKEGNYTSTVDGATKATYTFVEVPLLAQFHYDVWLLKFMAEAGFFGGYRLSVSREGEYMDEDYATRFHDYDRRFDYGAKFGGGFAVMLDPLELHFTARYKWSMSSIYKPDYNSEYYYRFAYPSDFVFSVGVHFQLTKRSGKTRSALRSEAKSIVWKEEENTGK